MKFWKKEWFRKKFKRFARGSISVMLCVLMTPFLSIACGLVELYRYQEASEILQEIIDISSLSTLANYDQYLHDRFGVMALAQDADPKTKFAEYFEKNKSLLGSHMTPGTPTIVPSKNLRYTTSSDGLYNVLLTQITDFSETTGMVEFLYEGLNIEDLINKLNELKGMAALTSGVTEMANLTAAIKDLVQNGKNLVDCVNSAVSELKSAKTQAQTTIDDIYAFYEKLNSNSFAIDTTSEETIKASYEKLAKDYLDDIKGIYSNLKTLVDHVRNFKSKVESIPGYITKMETALTSAKTAISNLSATVESMKSDGQDEAAKANEEAPSAMEEVVTSLEEALETAKTNFSDSVQSAMKDAADGFISDITELFPILSIDTDYFKLPLSQQAQDDLKLLIEAFPKTWDENGKEQLLEAIKNTYVPSLANLDNIPSLNSIFTVLINAVDKAAKDIVSDIGDSMVKILSALINTVKQLFGMNGAVDPQLDAMLSKTVSSSLTMEKDNPFQDLLDAIKELFNAKDTIVAVLTGEKAWYELLDAVKSVFESVKKTITAIVSAVGKITKKISSLMGYLTGGNKASFYDLILLSSYAAYNFPNRTNAGDTELGKDGNHTVKLDGSALTGYDYSDIVTAKTTNAGVPGVSGIQACLEMISSLDNGGDDEMFVGAELEYIIAGTESEMVNQVITFMDIFVIRLLLNLPAVFMDSNVATMATAANVFSWVVYLIVAIGEPIVDTILIANGGDVPFIKTACFLTPAGIVKLLDCVPKGIKATLESCLGDVSKLSGSYSKVDSVGGSFCLSYSEYCILILIITLSEPDILLRCANMMQLEAAAYYKSQGSKVKYDIKNSYTSLSVKVPVEVNSFLSVFDFNGMLFPAVVRERGY